MSAGELAEHFEVSKPTMSAHFAVLKEADLVDASKSGRTITYRLKMSVLEEAMLGFAQVFGLDVKPKHEADNTDALAAPAPDANEPPLPPPTAPRTEAQS